jgi:hypothetical protein
VLLALCVGSASGSPQSEPAKLYAKLLATSYAKSELPSGFTSATVTKATPSKTDRKYHSIGEIAVEYHGGPDGADFVFYYVFPNASDADADLNHPDLSGGAHVVGKVPGIAGPSILLAGSLTGKDNAGKTVTNGVTAVAAPDGFVLISAATVSVTNTKHGNQKVAVALLRSAISHLETVAAKH